MRTTKGMLNKAFIPTKGFDEDKRPHTNTSRPTPSPSALSIQFNADKEQQKLIKELSMKTPNWQNWKAK